MADTQKVVTMPEAAYFRIELIAAEQGTTPGEVLRKAFDLYVTALDHHKRGWKVGFAKPDQPLEKEVSGIGSEAQG